MPVAEQPCRSHRSYSTCRGASWKQYESLGASRAVAHLEADVPSPQADQLDVPLHEPGHRPKHEVCALLVVQTANEADQGHLHTGYCITTGL